MKLNDKKGIEISDIFNTLFPSTEVCIDLKLYTLKPGRMSEGDELFGSLRKDSEDHLTFTQKPMPEMEQVKPHKKTYPYPYEGKLLSLTERDDKTLRVHFKDFEISPDLTEKEIRKLGNMIKREFVNALLGLIEKKEVAR